MLTKSNARAVAAGLAIMLAGAAAQADTIELRADEWCPFNCEPGSEKPGYMVEIAREALALAGHEVNYETLNWARSLEQTRKGTVDGAIGAIPDEAPDFVFGPALGFYEETVAVRRGEVVDISAPANLAGLRVGAINGYEYYGPVADYIAANRGDRALVQYVSGDDALDKNLRKLVAGRVDMVAEVSAVLAYTIGQNRLGEQIEILHTGERGPIYIGFSPALESSERYARELAAGLAVLRESGRLAEIMDSYGLKVWE